MNKVHCKMKVFLSSFLTVCLILFNVSCGLDTVYVIDSPGSCLHEPIYSSIFEEDKYFEFITTEKKYEGIKFLGTEVYYKIYRSSSTMTNEKNAIVNAAGNDDTSSKAASLMIENYKYQTLEASGYYDEDVLIPSAFENRKIYIRLDDSSPYEAVIKVDGENIYGSSSRVIPGRNTPEKTSFNFYSNDTKTVPKSDDPDVKISGTGVDNEWYVCMFAVGVAQDANYTNLYSNILYLGSVKLNVK